MTSRLKAFVLGVTDRKKAGFAAVKSPDASRLTYDVVKVHADGIEIVVLATLEVH